MNTKNKTVGMTFFDGLLLMLVGFKLAGIIDWPWHQVILLPITAAILAGLVIGLVVVLGELLRSDG